MEDWATLAGRLHPALVHAPIGVLLGAFLGELLLGRSDDRGGVLTRRGLYVLAAVGALSSAATGWWLAREGYGGEVLFRHRWSGVGLAAVTAAAALVDLAGGAPRPRRVLLAVGLGLMVFAGHQGGTLTHGRGFLSFDLRGEREKTEGGEPPGGDAQVVRELLAARCVECHGPDKQKSGLRLDVIEDLRAVVEPGVPGNSELYRRLVLPPSSEDVMPPEEEGALTEAELLAVMRWIRGGAPMEWLEDGGE